MYYIFEVYARDRADEPPYGGKGCEIRYYCRYLCHDSTLNEDAMEQRVALCFLLLSIFAPVLNAQWIPIRTVPLITARQSEMQPSLARGMGNLSIVFDDPLGNLFLNPANAASLTGIVLFTSPTHNSWTNDDRQSVTTDLGSSRYPGTSATSIPFGAFLGGSNLFGGGLVAHQAYQTKTSIDRASLLATRAGQLETRDNTENNMYLFGLFGTRCAEGNAAIAGSVTWAQYGAMDGVNLLYPGSVDLSQNGWTVEYKLGAVGTIHERDRLEFLLGRSIARTSHHVTYPVVGFTDIRPNSDYRTEINKDESSQWLLNASYKRTLHRGWRVGAGITVNWKDHPKIPNYDLANIPRDPGTSLAYNLGLAALWSDTTSLWGIEYIYEPMTSQTWAEAGEQPANPQDQLLPPTFKTIENFFDFTNHIIRVGHRSHTRHPWLEYRFGAQLHIYSYSLDQQDNIAGTARSLSTDWVETTLSGGLSATLGDLQLMYTLQLVLGNGLVGTQSVTFRVAEAARANDILVAPSGELVVNELTLVTHQLALVYSIP